MTERRSTVLNHPAGEQRWRDERVPRGLAWRKNAKHSRPAEVASVLCVTRDEKRETEANLTRSVA